MVNVVIAGSSGERRLSLYFIVCWAGAGREGVDLNKALNFQIQVTITVCVCVCVCVYLLNCT